MKLCECGCQQPTQIVKITQTSAGYRAGDFRRFVNGHQQRNLVAKSYPKTKRDRVTLSQHRVRAEQALGKPLPPNAIVHHADGSRRMNTPLVICQDQHYHQLLHARMRIRARGGDPNTQRWCGACQRLRPVTAFSPATNRVMGVHKKCKPCAAAYVMQWNAKRHEATA